MVHENNISILIISGRESRQNQRMYFDKVDEGEDIIVQKEKNNAYALKPVSEDDLYFNAEMVKRIKESIKQVEYGKSIVISTEKENKSSLKNIIFEKKGIKMIDYKDYIEINPGIRFGKPCIKGTRISVYDVLNWLANEMSIKDILSDYPELTKESVQAALLYAAEKDHKIRVVA